MVAADPSAFRHGHFHFHHTKTFPNHFKRHEEGRQGRRWTRSGKRLRRLNKSAWVWGLPERPGHRNV